MTTKTATITAGGSLSNAVDLGGDRPGELHSLISLQMPATAWTAAALTFQGSMDGATYADVYKSDGNELSVSVGASRFVLLSPSQFAGLRYVKVRSGTSASPVAQAAGAVISLGVRSI